MISRDSLLFSYQIRRPRQGVSLATARHSVGEQQSVLALQDVTDQRHPNLVKHRSLVGILVKHI